LPKILNGGGDIISLIWAFELITLTIDTVTDRNKN